MSFFIDLLRAPERLVEQHADRAAVGVLAPRLLATIAVGAALFGTVPGSWRGGVQIAYAAIKMPGVFLLPLLVGLPLVAAIARVVGLDAPWSRVSLAGLVGAARSAVLAAVLVPTYWLVQGAAWSYHEAVLILAAALVVVGLPGLATLGALAPDLPRRALLTATAIVALGLPMAQGGWLLRPFVARPTAEVAFLRPVESNIADALDTTATSATGHYPGWEAESSGLLRQRVTR